MELRRGKFRQSVFMDTPQVGFLTPSNVFTYYIHELTNLSVTFNNMTNKHVTYLLLYYSDLQLWSVYNFSIVFNTSSVGKLLYYYIKTTYIILHYIQAKM